MKRNSIISILMVCCMFLASANSVSADNPTTDDVVLSYNLASQELTVRVTQCKQVLCQLSENYVSQIAVYRVSDPMDILLDERTYQIQELAWGMIDTFQVDAIEGEHLKVQVTMKDLNETIWPVLNKYITLGVSTTTTPDPSSPSSPSEDSEVPMESIILIGVISSAILVVIIVASRLLFRKTQ